MTAKANKMGRLNYKLEYDFKTTNLTVSIMQAADLVAMDSGGTSDPYVKVFFAGDKKKKFKTKVHPKTLNPTFNETFVFKNIPFGDMMAKTLMIQCFDFDRQGRYFHSLEYLKLCVFDFLPDLGNMIRLERSVCQCVKLIWQFEGWKDLDPPDDTEESPGDVCFSLRYVPTSGKFTVCILECKNLRKMDFGGLSDPFVKINLFLNGKKLTKKKTSVKKNTLNPYFNESFTFELKPEQLPNAHLILTCLDYDRIGTCDPIGKVAVGPKQEGKGLQHWMEMVNTLIDPDEFLKASKVS
ncbi:Synaptotagmin-1 [Folsomia candida]|uniref:Synaptotagmin-1 n=1 Tax=Folsomia candida TaxID=158441 RepID=A0A226D9N4_FOLCA|nr:Synaptotagmin-1 [Folsomia candida]